MMSWAELIVGLSIIIVVWYVYVVLRYYRKDLSAILKKRDTGCSSVKWERTTTLNNEEDRLVATTPNSTVDMHAWVHELMEEIKLIFTAAVTDRLTKEQILEALQMCLHKYPAMSSTIQQSINQHVISEFSLQLKMNLATEEINSLWKS